MQLDEIVGLQDHVVEFEERQLLVALEAHAHAVEGQHAVDREMAPDIAQELDVVELRQPLGVVDHQRIAAAIAEADEARERAPDAVLVPFDLIEGEQAPALVAAGRIADAGRAAAHQGDRLAAGLLQPMQHHDRQEMPDMQGRGRAVVAHIGGELAGPCLGVEALGIGALVDDSPARSARSGIRRSGRSSLCLVRVAQALHGQAAWRDRSKRVVDLARSS